MSNLLRAGIALKERPSCRLLKIRSLRRIASSAATHRYLATAPTLHRLCGPTHESPPAAAHPCTAGFLAARAQTPPPTSQSPSAQTLETSAIAVTPNTGPAPRSTHSHPTFAASSHAPSAHCQTPASPPAGHPQETRPSSHGQTQPSAGATQSLRRYRSLVCATTASLASNEFNLHHSLNRPHHLPPAIMVGSKLLLSQSCDLVKPRPLLALRLLHSDRTHPFRS